LSTNTITTSVLPCALQIDIPINRVRLSDPDEKTNGFDHICTFFHERFLHSDRGLLILRLSGQP